MNQSYEIDELIVHYLQGSLTPEEQVYLDTWIQASVANKQLFDRLIQSNILEQELQKLYAYDENGGWEKIRPHLGNKEKRAPVISFNRYKWIVAASIACLLIIAGWIYFTTGQKQVDKKPLLAAKKDVEAPKGTRAQIHLANGQTVPLDSITKGRLAKQGDMDVIKEATGQIVYKGAGNETQYNTLVNPRGGTVVSLMLNDGTKVWLNSASSLHFPVAFTGTERNVTVTGEAYFEVASLPLPPSGGGGIRKKMPFIVTGNGTRIEVLGTHFNVNTYTDETSSKITLLEGSVKLSLTSNGQSPASAILKPGEQGSISTHELSVVKNVDLDKVMSWKTGVFSFDEDDVPTIMRQLARWYDLEVVYTGNVPEDLYSGLVSRQLSLVQVLNMLQLAGVHYSINGKKIIVETKK